MVVLPKANEWLNMDRVSATKMQKNTQFLVLVFGDGYEWYVIEEDEKVVFDYLVRHRGDEA